MEKMPYQAALDTHVFSVAVEPVISSDWRQGLPVLASERVVLRELRGQPLDHPELLTVPETGYIKGALLEALD